MHFLVRRTRHGKRATTRKRKGRICILIRGNLGFITSKSSSFASIIVPPSLPLSFYAAWYWQSHEEFNARSRTKINARYAVNLGHSRRFDSLCNAHWRKRKREVHILSMLPLARETADDIVVYRVAATGLWTYRKDTCRAWDAADEERERENRKDRKREEKSVLR